MADFDGQPLPLLVARNEQPTLPDIPDIVPKPIDISLSAQSPWWSQRIFSSWPSKLWRSPGKSDAPPNTQSILPFAINRSFILASLICLLAFLLYIFPLSSRDMSSFRKHLPSKGLT